MKDPCAKFKKRVDWKRFYQPRLKLVEKNLDTQGRTHWKKLNTCSKMRFIDDLTEKGKFSYVING